MRPVTNTRRAAAVVELAVVLPFLIFLALITIDWARVFYYSVTLTSAARQGAIYGSDPIAAANSRYHSAQEAALAETSNLSPPPTVTTASGTDVDGNPYTQATVAWTFSTLTHYPGISSTVNLSRTVRMRVTPVTPG
jgi:Flp pilus assembly protein TadG